MSTLFTRIIRGDLPSEKVYETGSELAFLDINPKSEGHTLVVPKLEVAGFDALPTADLQSLIATVQLVTRGIIKAMGTPHYNIFL
ncbi:MAG: HIT domain-containing protein, partial [SAR324 cluster bacterium]|nr:HIT domain-containing protein [SAR324 cluster bacterium]